MRHAIELIRVMPKQGYNGETYWAHTIKPPDVDLHIGDIVSIPFPKGAREYVMVEYPDPQDLNYSCFDCDLMPLCPRTYDKEPLCGFRHQSCKDVLVNFKNVDAILEDL